MVLKRQIQLGQSSVQPVVVMVDLNRKELAVGERCRESSALVKDLMCISENGFSEKENKEHRKTWLGSSLVGKKKDKLANAVECLQIQVETSLVFFCEYFFFSHKIGPHQNHK